MSQMEMNRVPVLQKVLDGEVSTLEAASILGISDAYRLKAKLKTLGPAGRKNPPMVLPEDIRREVVQLAQTKYRGAITL